MNLSQISSHYAGMLKAHSASGEQQFAWEAIMTLACKLEKAEKRIGELEKELDSTSSKANYAFGQTARIGSST